MGGNRTPDARSECNGWTVGAARRNARFLMSVDWERLDGEGFSFSLTVGSLPASAAEWGQLLKKLRQRLERLGAFRMHWVTEFQRRGAPHLHGVAYFDGAGAEAGELIVRHWLELTRHLGTAHRAQHVAPIRTPVIWFQYVAKHASRGSKHYQRARSTLPPGWQGRTGRMWGSAGAWPVSVASFDVDQATFWRFRRFLRSYTRAQARQGLRVALRGGDRRSIGDAVCGLLWARRMAVTGDRRTSEVRGVSRWVPQAVSVELLHLARELTGGTVTVDLDAAEVELVAERAA